MCFIRLATGQLVISGYSQEFKSLHQILDGSIICCKIEFLEGTEKWKRPLVHSHKILVIRKILNVIVTWGLHCQTFYRHLRICWLGGSIAVWLVSSLDPFTLLIQILTTYFLNWLNPSQSKWRLAVQWYSPYKVSYDEKMLNNAGHCSSSSMQTTLVQNLKSRSRFAFST